MAHVISRKFGNWWDMKAQVAFVAMLDVSTMTYIGHAHVDLDAAKEKGVDYEAREGFEVLSDDAFAALMSKPAAPIPTNPTTGDPLTDAAQALPNGAALPKTRELTKTDSPEPAPGKAAALPKNTDGIPANALLAPAADAKAAADAAPATANGTGSPV